MFYLPPYAPELDPDEYLNRDLKTSIRSGPIARTAKALLEKTKDCTQRITSMPERVRSYFSHHAVRSIIRYFVAVVIKTHGITAQKHQ